MSAQTKRVVPFPQRPSPTPTRTQAKAPAPKDKTKVRPGIRFLVISVLTVYLLVAGSALIKQEMRMRDLMGRYRAVEQQQQLLQADNERLRQEIDRLKNDRAYIEQLAREMGMVKPSDVIYLPVTPQQGP